MPFPEVQRVVYGKNPLSEVVCQLRFPPILRIESEVPARFQDRIREEFPDFGETLGLQIEAPSELQGVAVPELLGRTAIRNYRFASEDDCWHVNLTRGFVALTTKKYERWEEFRSKLESPLSALVSIYSPTSFSRIGLRYINKIKRSQLGLEDVDWSELLEPHLMGLLRMPEVHDRVTQFESRYEIQLSDRESSVRIVTAFVDETNERCYVIDNDFFRAGKIDISAVTEHLDYFNQRGSRLFRWCITDRLHAAMEPNLL
jgi:uncharacterized protein (TIGR04255 family)